MRTFLVGEPDRLRKVTTLPQNLRDAYLGYLDLSGLDLFFHDMTNTTIYGCDVTNLRLPGAITTGHKQKRHKLTRNHNLYIRKCKGWETMIMPPHIGPDNYSFMPTLFHQRTVEATGDLKIVLAAVSAWVADASGGVVRVGDQSWIPTHHMFARRFGEAAIREAFHFAAQGHPDVEEFVTHLLDRNVTLENFKPLPAEYQNLRADLPPWTEVTLPQPQHPHDRFDVERQVEEIYWEHMDGSNRCHIWDLHPLRMVSGAISNPDDADWWIGIWKSG